MTRESTPTSINSKVDERMQPYCFSSGAGIEIKTFLNQECLPLLFTQAQLMYTQRQNMGESVSPILQATYDTTLAEYTASVANISSTQQEQESLCEMGKLIIDASLGDILGKWPKFSTNPQIMKQTMFAIYEIISNGKREQIDSLTPLLGRIIASFEHAQDYPIEPMPPYALASQMTQYSYLLTAIEDEYFSLMSEPIIQEIRQSGSPIPEGLYFRYPKNKQSMLNEAISPPSFPNEVGILPKLYAQRNGPSCPLINALLSTNFGKWLHNAVLQDQEIRIQRRSEFPPLVTESEWIAQVSADPTLRSIIMEMAPKSLLSTLLSLEGKTYKDQIDELQPGASDSLFQVEILPTLFNLIIQKTPHRIKDTDYLHNSEPLRMRIFANPEQIEGIMHAINQDDFSTSQIRAFMLSVIDGTTTSTPLGKTNLMSANTIDKMKRINKKPNNFAGIFIRVPIAISDSCIVEIQILASSQKEYYDGHRTEYIQQRTGLKTEKDIFNQKVKATITRMKEEAEQLLGSQNETARALSTVILTMLRQSKSNRFLQRCLANSGIPSINLLNTQSGFSVQKDDIGRCRIIPLDNGSFLLIFAPIEVTAKDTIHRLNNTVPNPKPNTYAEQSEYSHSLILKVDKNGKETWGKIFFNYQTEKALWKTARVDMREYAPIVENLHKILRSGTIIYGANQKIQRSGQNGNLDYGKIDQLFPPRTDALATIEKIDPNFFQSIRSHHPDGYIVATGCGMSLCLPLGMKTGETPRGVILVNDDPVVIALSKAFINAVKQTNDATEFYNAFSRDPITFANNFLTDDPEAASALAKMKTSDIERLNQQIKKSMGDSNIRVSKGGDPGLDNLLAATYPVWKMLVSENKIIVINGVLTDSVVIDEITSLPDYDRLKHIVYLSNIADDLVSSRSWEECAISLTAFKDAMGQYNPQQNHAIFVNTLRGFNYWLRVTEGTPLLCPADVMLLNQYSFPGIQFPHTHYEKQPKKYTPLNYANMTLYQLNTILRQTYIDLSKQYGISEKQISQAIIQIGTSIFVNKTLDLKYFGGIQPIEWARYRFGEPIGKAIAIYIEILGKGL